MALTCTNCQIQLPDDAAFCYKCGKSVTVPIEEEKITVDASLSRELWRFGSQVQVVDFDTYKDELYHRAQKWAEYYASLFHDKNDWYSSLFMLSQDVNSLIRKFHHFTEETTYFFPTNKPNTHEALFREAFIAWFINEAVQRGYLQYNSGWVFSPEALASLKQTFSKWDEEQLVFQQPDYEKIKVTTQVSYRLAKEPEDV
jgi:hypothetical protein